MLGAALEHLGDERAARRQHADREVGGELDELHDADVVGGAMAGRRRRHVGQHEVGLVAAERGDQRLRRVLVVEVLLEQDHAGDRVHVEIVDADDQRMLLGRADDRRRDLAPAARRGAEVDDPLPLAEAACSARRAP